MSHKPRYSRISDIFDLAIFMSSKIQGVTITEIAQRYNVSRRTAERMRDSLTCIFPSVDEIETDDTQKHWGFINYSISNLQTLFHLHRKKLQILNSFKDGQPIKK